MELSRTIAGYLRPRSIDELERILADPPPGARLVAGGTDVMVKLRAAESPSRTCLVSLLAIPELGRLRAVGGGVEIGAAARLSELVAHLLLADFPAVAEAARSVAGPSIRNTATVGGNVCNASPSADLSVALLAADAEAVIGGAGAGRRLPLADFFAGPGATALGRGEYLRALFLPTPAAGSRSAFRKLGVRSVMEIAIVNVAIRLDRGEGSACAAARVALGAVAPVPMRARTAEASLVGKPIGGPAWAEAAAEAARVAATEARPISDRRASAEYRRDMVQALVAETLGLLGSAAHGEPASGRSEGR